MNAAEKAKLVTELAIMKARVAAIKTENTAPNDFPEIKCTWKLREAYQQGKL